MQRPAPRLPWKLESWCERCPAKGGERSKRRTWSEEKAEEEEKVQRERRVEADTLGNLYNYPQGRPEAVGGRWRGRGGWWLAECREGGGGTHIDPGNHPAPRAPSSSLRATATRPPPCSRFSILFLVHSPSLPPNRSLFYRQLSACLQCFVRRVFMSSLALKPPTLLKFDERDDDESIPRLVDREN
jgi:hypothetical protein